MKPSRSSHPLLTIWLYITRTLAPAQALESLQTDSSMLTVHSSTSGNMAVPSPFETTVERALSSELSAMGFHEGTVAKLAQRMSLELASSGAGRGAPIRAAKSGVPQTPLLVRARGIITNATTLLADLPNGSHLLD